MEGGRSVLLPERVNHFQLTHFISPFLGFRFASPPLACEFLADPFQPVNDSPARGCGSQDQDQSPVEATAGGSCPSRSSRDRPSAEPAGETCQIITVAAVSLVLLLIIFGPLA